MPILPFPPGKPLFTEAGNSDWQSSAQRRTPGTRTQTQRPRSLGPGDPAPCALPRSLPGWSRVSARPVLGPLGGHASALLSLPVSRGTMSLSFPLSPPPRDPPKPTPTPPPPTPVSLNKTLERPWHRGVLSMSHAEGRASGSQSRELGANSGCRVSDKILNWVESARSPSSPAFDPHSVLDQGAGLRPGLRPHGLPARAPRSRGPRAASLSFRGRGRASASSQRWWESGREEETCRSGALSATLPGAPLECPPPGFRGLPRGCPCPVPQGPLRPARFFSFPDRSSPMTGPGVRCSARGVLGRGAVTESLGGGASVLRPHVTSWGGNGQRHSIISFPKSLQRHRTSDLAPESDHGHCPGAGWRLQHGGRRAEAEGCAARGPEPPRNGREGSPDREVALGRAFRTQLAEWGGGHRIPAEGRRGGSAAGCAPPPASLTESTWCHGDPHARSRVVAPGGPARRSCGSVPQRQGAEERPGTGPSASGRGPHVPTGIRVPRWHPWRRRASEPAQPPWQLRGGRRGQVQVGCHATGRCSFAAPSPRRRSHGAVAALRERIVGELEVGGCSHAHGRARQRDENTAQGGRESGQGDVLMKTQTLGSSEDVGGPGQQ